MVSERIQRRKHTWLSFALVVLAVCGRVASVEQPVENSLTIQTPESEGSSAGDAAGSSRGTIQPQEQIVDSIRREANESYNKALSLISQLPKVPTQRTPWSTEPSRPTSFLASLFPNHEGPLATAIRVLGRLEQDFWITRIFRKTNGAKMNARQLDLLRSRAARVVELLEHSADLGNHEALYLLAQFSLFPPPSIPLDAAKAFNAYNKHAELTGNATSQAIVAFFHSSGYKDVVPVNQGQALLYYTFAALGGDQGAEMALGYRYWSGIGVSEDCMAALSWYESAAEKCECKQIRKYAQMNTQAAMDRFISGPPGGRTLPHTALKLSDFAGGVYGYGASLASTSIMAARPVIKASQAHAMGERWEEVIQYWQYHAERGDLEASYRLGKIFYHGGIYNPPGGIASGAEGASAIQKDFSSARSHFLKVARKVYPRDDPSKPLRFKSTSVETTDLYYATLASHYLGRIHLRGEGVRQDIKMAKMWLERGAKGGDKESLNALGVIHRDGLLDGKVKENVALVQFSRAAAQDLPEALVNMGKIYFNRGNMQLAKTYFDSAIRHGSQFEAYYYAALIHAHMARLTAQTKSSPAGGSCSIATTFFKVVAERGCWKNNLMAEAEKLWQTNGYYEQESAMLRWAIAADRGVEAAQNNIAFILDQDRRSSWSLRRRPPPDQEKAKLALVQWTRSAGQGDVDAMVKLGDYHFHGIGVDEPDEVLHEKAASYYHSAIETHSSIAMWNVGWMYENGIGLPQDYHLAKRHYDMVLEYNSQAYFPVVLSLVKLHLRSLWYIITGGTQTNLILWGDDANNDHWWPNKLWKTEAGLGEAPADGKQPNADSGRGRLINDDDDDPVQRARDIRDAATNGDDDDPGEDYFDGMTRRGAGKEDDDLSAIMDDDQYWENIVLIGLFVTIAGLFWLRGRYREEEERRRREHQLAAQQGQAGVQGADANPPPPQPGAVPRPDPQMAMFM